MTCLRETLKEKKISLFHPKKDRCDVCFAHEQNPEEVPNHQQHLATAQAAQKEKAKDKCIKDPNIIVLCCDKQAILMAPSIEASMAYYHTKLNVHNSTILNLKTNDATNNVWHEGEGGSDSTIFASILIANLKSYLQKNPQIKKIIIYSDGCNYQNRCKLISNALLHFSLENNIIIEQKYLEKGHTHMEVDNVHAHIEHKIRGQVINEPQEYIEHMKSARKLGYEVKYLTYDFFKDYSKIQYYTSIRPGAHKAGEPQVTDLRCIKYTPTPTPHIEFKLNYTQQYEPLRQKINLKTSTEITPLYTEKLKIKSDKYRHLQILKTLVKSTSRTFYDDLPHE